MEAKQKVQVAEQDIKKVATEFIKLAESSILEVDENAKNKRVVVSFSADYSNAIAEKLKTEHFPSKDFAIVKMSLGSLLKHFCEVAIAKNLNVVE